MVTPESPTVAGSRLDPERREALILDHLPLVRALARRYANRGEPVDDLEQAGTIGLIKAVDRFDPAVGREFRSFATPTILGEIRRHFRDKTWAVRVPRGLKDDYARVVGVMSHLTGELGRSPTIADIGRESGLTEEQVLDALAALPARERVIIHLRFDKGLMQSDIARIMGISQMHVSRLIARALERMRETAGEDTG